MQIFGTRTHCDVMFAAHHDVRSYDTRVITDRFDKKYLDTKRGRRSNLLLSQSGHALIPWVAMTTRTLKPFSAPNLRIISRLSLVVFVASKT